MCSEESNYLNDFVRQQLRLTVFHHFNLKVKRKIPSNVLFTLDMKEKQVNIFNNMFVDSLIESMLNL